jgi:cytochrome c oxidase accessory protein FixG
MSKFRPPSWHRLRKSIHLFCFLAFLALPFLNVIRFDIPRQRFYFAGYELWIGEFAIIFFALMFLMFLVVLSSVFYGRVYCGYLCPQMIFSEASMAVETRIRRRVVRKFGNWKPRSRERLVRALFHAVVGAASVLLAFIFVSYFVEPRDLLRSLLSFDVRTAAGISGAAVTVVAYLDFTLVRLRFCATVCPYGYLQGMLGDGHTLLVHYRDGVPKKECIECKKCVRVCPMDIDIRTSPFQIECVHCGECIDACDEILGRLGKPGLIHYAWGEKGETVAQARALPWYRRVGLRDAKRVVVLAVLTCYAAGLFAALSMRHPVLTQVAPVRATLYRLDAGRVWNHFRYTISNRGSKPAAVVFSFAQLPEAAMALAPNPVPVKPGETVEGEFDISMPLQPHEEPVRHFTILTETDSFPMTFLAPEEAP